MTGLKFAKGRFVFQIDSDLEEEPELLVRFWDEMQKSVDIDVIYGVQASRKGGWFEKASGALFYRVYNMLSSIPVPQNVIAARLMNRRYVNALKKFREQEIFLAGLWSAAGFNQKPVEVIKHSREGSDYSFWKKLSLTVNSITSFSEVPLKAIFAFGGGITFLSSLYIVFLIFIRLFFHAQIDGWTTIIVSIWFLAGHPFFPLVSSGFTCQRCLLKPKKDPTPLSGKCIGPKGMKMPDKDTIREDVTRYFKEKIQEFGPMPEGVGWNSDHAQEKRFEVLCRLISKDESFSLNDLGCGYGRLADYLADGFGPCAYHGYDISEDMLESARRREYELSTVEFSHLQRADMMAENDYTVASGIFNVKMDYKETRWLTYILETLEAMNEKSVLVFPSIC